MSSFYAHKKKYIFSLSNTFCKHTAHVGTLRLALVGVAWDPIGRCAGSLWPCGCRAGPLWALRGVFMGSARGNNLEPSHGPAV